MVRGQTRSCRGRRPQRGAARTVRTHVLFVLYTKTGYCYLGVGQLLVHCPLHSAALLHRLRHTHRLSAVPRAGSLLAHLLVDCAALLNVLHHGGLLVPGHTGGLVLGLTHFVGNLKQSSKSAHGKSEKKRP